MGRNTETIVNDIAITERDTSFVPSRAASLGCAPRSMCRKIFSRTTIASSSTRPTARESASSVIIFNERPNAFRMAKDPIMMTGMPAMVTKVFLCKKNRSTKSSAKRIKMM